MSKSVIGLGLLAFAVLPLQAGAQTAAVVPVDDTPAAAPETSPAPDAAPAESTPASADSNSGASDSSPASAASDSDAGSSSSSGGDSEGLRYFVAVDRSEITLDLSNDKLVQRYGSDKMDGGFYRVRAGVHLIPAIAIEAQGGFLPDDAKSANEFKVGHFYALYLVPTGTFLNTVEVSARVGYAWLGAPRAGEKHSFDGVSYGVSFELPIRKFSESLPDLRLIAGGTVFTQEKAERSYGFNYGLRYDFGL